MGTWVKGKEMLDVQPQREEERGERVGSETGVKRSGMDESSARRRYSMAEVVVGILMRQWNDVGAVW